MTPGFEPDLFNLWLLFGCGGVLQLAFFIWAGVKRGQRVEDIELYRDENPSGVILMGLLPMILIFTVSIFIPFQAGMQLWTGIAVYAAGLILHIGGSLSFAFAPVGLNTYGLYRFSRNPMYIGWFLIVLGLNILGWNVTLANIILASFTLYFAIGIHWFVLHEEKFLRAKYGDLFNEFCNKTPRYFGFSTKKNPLA